MGSDHVKKSLSIEATVEQLGADIRNDLNNLLQQMVTLLHLVKLDPPLQETSPSIDFLSRIDATAKDISVVVNELEQRIKKALL